MEAFLETTAIVDLLFKDKITSDKIRMVLKKYAVKYSSQYVRMEIKRGVLRYFVALHNKAVECKSLSEVHTYVSALSATPHRHRLSTTLKAIADFYRDFEQRELKTTPNGQTQTDFQKTMLAAFLRTRIKRFWTAFEKAVDIVLDEAECYKNKYTLAPPTYDGKVFDNTLSNCDKFKPGICRLRELCNDNEDALLAIQSHLSALNEIDAETQNRLRAIKEVLRVKKETSCKENAGGWVMPC